MVSAAEGAGKGGRRLERKAEGSNPDEPAKKKLPKEAEEEAEDEEISEDEKEQEQHQIEAFDDSTKGLARMMQTMMQDIKDMKRMQRQDAKEAKKDKDDIRAEIQVAAEKAERAAEAASQAKEATSALKVEMDKIKKGQGLEETLAKAIDKAVQEKYPTISGNSPGVGHKGAGKAPPDPRANYGGGIDKGKGSGKSTAAIVEQRSRTITFGHFPEGTKAEAIKKFMESTLVLQKEDIDESYAFGKKYAERGAVRFKACAGMWKYMQENAGSHKHQHEGKDIYVNVYSSVSEGMEMSKEKAVRKLTRAIKETVKSQEGGDGKEIRSDIGTNYKSGVVKYLGRRMGEWQGESMEITDEGKQFAVAFRTLMGK